MLKDLKTNILLLLSSLLIICLILYLTTFLYFKFVRGYNKIEPIQYKEEINFIEKYSKKLASLRNENVFCFGKSSEVGAKYLLDYTL